MITDQLLTSLVTYGWFGALLFILFYHVVLSYAAENRYKRLKF